MESTVCAQDECKFVKAKFCKRCVDCPFYVESWWQSKEGESKLIKDCFPKRSILLQQEMINRSLATQAANEQSRNEFHYMSELFTKAMRVLVSSNQLLLELSTGEKPAEIENKEIKE